MTYRACCAPRDQALVLAFTKTRALDYLSSVASAVLNSGEPGRSILLLDETRTIRAAAD